MEGQQLMLADVPYTVRGVNYYPSRYPWKRFLTESDMATVERELDLMASAGINTLRIFLWFDALFDCEANGAVPVAESFARLDALIHAAAARNIRLIVTLNDLPDLDVYPLYSNPPHIQAQTVFIVERYRDEAAILAWDLRNEGDIDYGSNNALGGRFRREDVLDWLAATTDLVHQYDATHLITAGWLRDAESTAPHVDFISFHHWSSADELRGRIAGMRAATDKPILLEELGYNTLHVSEDEQAVMLDAAITVTEEEGLLGWMIWTAFDFPLDVTCEPQPCVSAESYEHHFGLWRADYTPKPSVDVITLRAGQAISAVVTSIPTPALRQITILTEDRVEFVDLIPFGSGGRFEEICLWLDQRVLWEEGNFVDELQPHFQSDNGFRLLVNGEQLDYASRRVYTITSLLLYFVTDDTHPLQNPRGSYGDLMYCFRTDYLPTGRHSATFTAYTLSGVGYTYDWEFMISDPEQ